MQGYVLEMLSSVTVTADIEDGSVIEYPIQCTQEIVIVAEVVLPQRRVLVASEYDVVASLAVVSPVDHVEEKPGVFLVEFTMAYLINDQTCRLDQPVQAGSFSTVPAGRNETVTQFRHFDEICL